MPLPALKSRNALWLTRPGERLEVPCADPMAAIDILNLLNKTGDPLENTKHDDGRTIFLIEKANAVARWVELTIEALVFEPCNGSPRSPCGSSLTGKT